MEKADRAPLSRRAFLKAATVGVVSLAAAPVLSACGTSAPAPAPTAAKAAAPAPTTAAAPASTAGAPPAPTKAPEPAKKVDFPVKGKSITWIAPFAAGTGPDVGVRLLAPALEKELGVPVEVVNRTGANGQIGYQELAKARPDGYTISLVVLPGIATIYLDPERQSAFTRNNFQPLAMHVQDPTLFIVLANSPYKTLKDLIDAAKANPEKISVSAGGLLGDDHLSILNLQKLAGVKFSIVQMSDNRQSALLGGHTEVYAGKTATMWSQIKSGDVRTLAITSKDRSKFVPDVKTMIEQGYNYTSYASRGYCVPASTPKEIVDILSAAMKRAITSPEHAQKLDEMGLVPNYTDPDTFGKYWTDMEPSVKELMQLAKA